MLDVLFTTRQYFKRFKVLKVPENDFHRLCKEHRTTLDAMIYAGYVYERQTGVGLTEKGYLA